MGKKTAMEGGENRRGEVSLTKFDVIWKKANSLLVAWIFTPALTPPFSLTGFSSNLLFFYGKNQGCMAGATLTATSIN